MDSARGLGAPQSFAPMQSRLEPCRCGVTVHRTEAFTFWKDNPAQLDPRFGLNIDFFIRSSAKSLSTNSFDIQIWQWLAFCASKENPCVDAALGRLPSALGRGHAAAKSESVAAPIARSASPLWI